VPRKGNWKREEAKARRALARNKARIDGASWAGTAGARGSGWRRKLKRDEGR